MLDYQVQQMLSQLKLIPEVRQAKAFVNLSLVEIGMHPQMSLSVWVSGGCKKCIAKTIWKWKGIGLLTVGNITKKVGHNSETYEVSFFYSK